MLTDVISQIKDCSICKDHLPFEPRPVFRANSKARIAIIGQAPGTLVHNTGIPWNDKSGERLRDWMTIDVTDFYDPELCAIVPMGFCYPGKGKSGDLPPRKECAPQWHKQLFDQIPNLELTLLIGKYAQDYYLPNRKSTLNETVKCFQEYLPKYFVLPHPSPRNNIWMKKNDWFEKEVIPELKNYINKLLNK